MGAISRVQSRHRRLASVGRLETLSRSPLRSVREHADRTIERFDLFGSVRSREARWLPATVASWMARRSPDTLRDELNSALGDASRVRAALSLVRRLGLADQSVEQVAGVAIHASDPSTRAQATLLLGRVSRDSDAADRAFRSLAELLGDDADRVRADAIEAMSRLRAMACDWIGSRSTTAPGSARTPCSMAVATPKQSPMGCSRRLRCSTSTLCCEMTAPSTASARSGSHDAFARSRWPRRSQAWPAKIRTRLFEGARVAAQVACCR